MILLANSEVGSPAPGYQLTWGRDLVVSDAATKRAIWIRQQYRTHVGTGSV